MNDAYAPRALNSNSPPTRVSWLNGTRMPSVPPVTQKNL
jgi:hypothetical protein